MAQAKQMDSLDPNYDPEDKYTVQSDADTLQKHTQITSDPDRHAAAHEELQNRQKLGQKAVKKSGASLHQKVKKGLKKAFGPPAANGKTPFEAAGQDSKPED